jgi:DNA-directed RNA polymerase subunit M/transcription elongation factor TFIIS
MSIAYPPERAQSIYSTVALLEKVQTIGYRQPNGLEEIERIMSADPSTILVDIRFKPTSHNLHWTKQAFSKKYQKRYFWLKALGNVTHDQPGHIQIADPETGIKQLVQFLQDHNVLLMCGCPEYEQCHRKVVYDLLVQALNAQTLEATCFSPAFYVDEIREWPNTPLKYKKWCHLATSGSIDDLHAFAEKIGLQRAWFQDKPTHPHYDLTPGKRAAALKHGARAVTTIELINACHPRLSEIGAQAAKALEATCFSEENAPASTGDGALRAENARLLATLDYEREKHAYWRTLALYEQTTAAQIVIDQEEELKRLRDYDTQRLTTIGKARSLIQRLLQQRKSARASIQKLTTALQQVQQERDQWKARYEREAQRVKQFRQSPFKPTERLIIDELQFQLENPNARKDAEGYTSVCLETVGKHINMSASTAGRGIEAIQKQWAASPLKYKKVPERTADGRDIDRLYIKTEAPNIVPLALRADLSETKIQQGGDRYTCAKCGGTHVKRQIIKEILLVCDDCGHSSILEEETVSTDYPNASYTKQDAAKRKASAPNLQANIITSDPPSVCADPRPEAAALLLAIAGQHEKHIIMPRRHESKYLEVKRPLTLEDMANHLAGGEARGAPCSYENDQTRALCKDADDIDSWTILEQAAKKLAQQGYIPLLEESPADRGGHLWIIFDQLVNATTAREAVYQIAPELREITEYWPAPPDAEKWNRVRLPGSYYYNSGEGRETVKGWCRLLNVATGETSRDGKEAAALLLASLTPAAIVPPAPAQNAQPCPPPASAETSTARTEQPRASVEDESGCKLPLVDEKWEQKNGKITETKLYFAIMPEYAARWFNEHHTLEEIHPREKNGFALSPNGAERTASTSYHIGPDGQERYTDHSAHGSRPDGTKDSGDALQLAVKVWGVSKSSLLYETTKEISQKSRAALEEAARAGQPIPAWLEEPCIITPAGRKRHAWLKAQAARQAQRLETPAQDEQPAQRERIVNELQKVIEETRTAQPAAPEIPEMRKIGTCLLPTKTGEICGSTRWYPSKDEEWICVKCYSPIAWTRRIETDRKATGFSTHENK